MRSVWILILLFSSCQAFAQASDFISVKKKNNRTVKTYFPGLRIQFTTEYGREVNGIIESIHSDTVFVREWDTRLGGGYFGLPRIDTVGVYLTGYYYKEIKSVTVKDRSGSLALLPGRILMIGGTGYAVLNLINAGYLHESVGDSKNLRRLGIAGAAVVTGFVANKLLRIKSKLRIEYVHMDSPGSPKPRS
ncbi:MAG: hypothetical protein KGO82_02080 [Bacteroidota bacterium]|nr:hypothetical protein [Bacteroidota bacterium]